MEEIYLEFNKLLAAHLKRLLLAYVRGETLDPDVAQEISQLIKKAEGM